MVRVRIGSSYATLSAPMVDALRRLGELDKEHGPIAFEFSGYAKSCEALARRDLAMVLGRFCRISENGRDALRQLEEAARG